MKDYTIDYTVPTENIPCSQWENIGSRYHGKCKAGLFGGAPSKGTCMLKCDNLLSENPNFNRKQYAADLTMYGYRLFEYPPYGLGDFVHSVIKILTLGLVPMCAACSRRRALLNRWWFATMRRLTGSGMVGVHPEELMYPDLPDAAPPPNAVPDGQHNIPQTRFFDQPDELVNPPKKKCSPCEEKKRRLAEKLRKEQEDGLRD
jgi:hypothetical protein